jgi:hypothetical protein
LQLFLQMSTVQIFHLSCSSPQISGSERPNWQAKSACQAGWSFLLLCNIRESKEGKGHFATLFVSSENLGGGACPPGSYAPAGNGAKIIEETIQLM